MCECVGEPLSVEAETAKGEERLSVLLDHIHMKQDRIAAMADVVVHNHNHGTDPLVMSGAAGAGGQMLRNRRAGTGRDGIASSARRQ